MLKKILCCCFCFTLFGCTKTVSSEKIYVVTTFSILEDFANEVLGKNHPHIVVKSLIERSQDPHGFNPKPQDCIQLKNAKILIVNGLGFEHWLDKFIESTDFKGEIITATRGVKPLRSMFNPDVYDPHAWHSVENAKIYVTNIAEALKKIVPGEATKIDLTLQAYLEQLSKLEDYIKQKFIEIKNRNIVTTHDAFWYYGKTYGINFISPLGISTEEEHSAKRVAEIIKFIKERKIKAILFENLSNPGVLKQIAKETNSIIGSEPLYADSLSPENGPASSYISMVKYNTEQIYKILKEADAS